jgi:hypothetical protein
MTGDDAVSNIRDVVPEVSQSFLGYKLVCQLPAAFLESGMEELREFGPVAIHPNVGDIQLRTEPATFSRPENG